MDFRWSKHAYTCNVVLVTIVTDSFDSLSVLLHSAFHRHSKISNRDLEEKSTGVLSVV